MNTRIWPSREVGNASLGVGFVKPLEGRFSLCLEDSMPGGMDHKDWAGKRRL